MSRAVSPIVSDFYAQAHAQWGVKLLLNTRLERIRGEGGRVVGVSLSEGRELPADLVLVGIGIEPEADAGAERGA